MKFFRPILVLDGVVPFAWKEVWVLGFRLLGSFKSGILCVRGCMGEDLDLGSAQKKREWLVASSVVCV